MIRPGYDTCDGTGCGVTASIHIAPFPHLASCKYGNGQPPVCVCSHGADLHSVGAVEGSRCHGCFVGGSPAGMTDHHLYMQRR